MDGVSSLSAHGASPIPGDRITSFDDSGENVMIFDLYTASPIRKATEPKTVTAAIAAAALR